MNRPLLFSIFTIIICTNAHANTCQTTNDDYYACKPGYYLNSGDCAQCPVWSGVYTNASRTTAVRGTSKDSNTDSITSCYIPATGPYYDSTGTFSITADCNYTL